MSPEIPKQLETERLLLRQVRLDDLDDYARIFGQPQVQQYIGDGKPLDRGGAFRSMATLLGHWSMRGYGMWMLEEKSSGRVVGRAGLWQPEGWPGLEVGWALDPSSWGKGYASEAARVSLQLGFDVLRADVIYSLIHPDNTRSIRTAERLGETFQRLHRIGDLEVALYGIHRVKSAGSGATKS